jgi:hypothetical protein
MTSGRTEQRGHVIPLRLRFRLRFWIALAWVVRHRVLVLLLVTVAWLLLAGLLFTLLVPGAAHCHITGSQQVACDG